MPVDVFGLGKMRLLMSLKNKIKKKIKIYPFYKFNPYFTYFISHPNKSFILHILKSFLCTMINFFNYYKKNKVTVFFCKNGFYKKIIKEKETPEILFNLLEKKLNSHQKIIYNHLENFTYSKKKVSDQDNQQFVYDIEKSFLIKIDDYVRSDKDFDLIIKNYFKSEYRIVNLRIWRYLPESKSLNNEKVGAHYDMFPHKTVKIMIYKGFFGKKNPSLEILNAEKNETLIFSVCGRNPIVIFDSNHLYHRANLPKKNRDTIEITIQPTFFDKKPLFGGFSAGYPLNPFKKNRNKIFL